MGQGGGNGDATVTTGVVSWIFGVRSSVITAVIWELDSCRSCGISGDLGGRYRIVEARNCVSCYTCTSY